MKNILITGGLGFLGSYSIEKWKKHDWQITIIDNLSTNVIEPDDQICKDCNVIISDILDCSWQSLENYDLILHLASPVGPAGILKHSGKMANYILSDIYWAAEGAQINKCPLVFVSTSEIYGHRDEAILLKEDDDKILRGSFAVRNEYSMAKLLSEIVLSNLSKVSDLKYQIIRPFNISGARQLINGGFVLPTFVTQALGSNPITVFNSGEQVRAFTHVKDIIDGIYLVSEAGKDLHNECWNIGNSSNTGSINELAEIVKAKTESKSEIIHVDPKTIHGPLYEEAWDKIPDATKAKTLLGWEPAFSKEQIIDDVIKFYEGKNEE
jgi:nucleoside-diphosphate-sugar epimerase